MSQDNLNIFEPHNIDVHITYPRVPFSIIEDNCHRTKNGSNKTVNKKSLFFFFNYATLFIIGVHFTDESVWLLGNI